MASTLVGDPWPSIEDPDLRKRAERGAYNGVVRLDTQPYQPFDAAEMRALSDAVDAHAAFFGKTTATVNPLQQLERAGAD